MSSSKVLPVEGSSPDGGEGRSQSERDYVVAVPEASRKEHQKDAAKDSIPKQESTASNAEEPEKWDLPQNAYTVIFLYLLSFFLFRTDEGLRIDQVEKGVREADPAGRFNERMALFRQFIFSLACSVMQLVLPLLVIVEFARGDERNGLHSSFAALFSPVPDTPGGSPPQYMVSIQWIRFVKASVSLYVIYFITHGDLIPLSSILKDTPGFDAAYPKRVLLLKFVLASCYLSAITLVYISCLVLIARSNSVTNIILSAVGTLFILDFDDQLVVKECWLTKELEPAVFAEELRLRAQSDGKWVRAVSDYVAHVGGLVAVSTAWAFWMYFMYRICQ